MKPKSCIDNLKICKGECCRYFVFNCELDEEMREYYNMHENVKAVGNQIFILNKCKNLGPDNKCKIYDKRPKICREGYTHTSEGIDYPETCIYK